MQFIFLFLCITSVALATDKPKEPLAYRVLIRLAPSRAKLSDELPANITLSSKDASSASPEVPAADCNNANNKASACTVNSDSNLSSKEITIKSGAEVLLWNGAFPDGFMSGASIRVKLISNHNSLELDGQGESSAAAKIMGLAKKTHFFVGKWRELCRVSASGAGTQEGKQHVFVKILPTK